MLTLGPAIMALLDVLQFRHGVSIQAVDASLRPAQPVGAADFAGILEEPGVRERCLAALRSGEGRVERGLPIPLGGTSNHFRYDPTGLSSRGGRGARQRCLARTPVGQMAHRRACQTALARRPRAC